MAVRLADGCGIARAGYRHEFCARRGFRLRRQHRDRRSRVPCDHGRSPTRRRLHARHARGRHGRHREALPRTRRGRGRLARGAARRPRPWTGITTLFPTGASSRTVCVRDGRARSVPEVDDAPASFSARWIQRNCAGDWALPAPFFPTTSAWAARRSRAPFRSARAARSKRAATCCRSATTVAAVLATLDELEGEADPLSQVRLVRLHGRPMPAASNCADGAMARVPAAVDHCRDAPSLQLNA